MDCLIFFSKGYKTQEVVLLFFLLSITNSQRILVSPASRSIQDLLQHRIENPSISLLHFLPRTPPRTHHHNAFPILHLRALFSPEQRIWLYRQPFMHEQTRQGGANRLLRLGMVLLQMQRLQQQRDYSPVH